MLSKLVVGLGLMNTVFFPDDYRTSASEVD